MKVKDKEIHFAYTIGVYCDFNDFVLAHPDISIATANIHKAAMMSKAYADMNGGAAVTIEEIMSLPYADLADLMGEVKAAEDRDGKRTVETVEKKPTKQ